METADPKATFARRLLQARTMRGLSLRGLAEALQGAVSHSALAKYENGEMMPGSDLICRLADALGRSPDFFFRPFTLQLKDVKFRKRTRLGAKEQEAIREQAVEYFERYHEIEEQLGEPRAFDGRLQVAPIKTPEQAEAAAGKLRDDWQLGRDPLPNVVELLESKGIKVFEVATADDAFDGFYAWTEAGPVIVLAGKLNENLLRKRMTAVHELAHVILPMPASLTEKEEEKLVNRFAGALLLPEETFVAQFGRVRGAISLGELIELKANFGASISAIMMRARQLELISEAVSLRFWKRHGSTWRSEKKEPGDERYRGNESHSRFRQLVQRAVAEDQVSMVKGAALLNQSLGEFRRELREVFV